MRTLKSFIIVILIFSYIENQAQFSPLKKYNQDIHRYDTATKDFKSFYTPKAPPGAPNIVIIMLDDVGYSTASTFGGIAETPVFDSLAKVGLKYINFHTTSICAPSRAALLTGRNQHSVNMGHFAETAFDAPGYDSNMPFEKATMAEVLRENGYNTFMVGKWHLTPVTDRTAAGPFNRWPTGRGFDRFYGFLESATDQYYPVLWDGITRSYEESNEKHLSTRLVDKSIQYIQNQQRAAPGKPFLLYVAPGALHSPMQTDKAWIDKYKGKFDTGWDKYREVVLANQKKLKVVPEYATLPERNSRVRAWDSLSEDEKKIMSRAMEAHAGFLSQVDFEIGRLLGYISNNKLAENTIVIMIIGDNGATQYTADIPGVPAGVSPTSSREEKINAALKNIDQIGRKDFKGDIPLGWTQATNTPFKYYKTDANSEGGTHNPMIISFPKYIKAPDGIRNQYVHLIDVWPTLLELTKAKIPPSINGYVQHPIEGTSFAYSLNDADAKDRHTLQYYEAGASCALYKDGWKAETHHVPGTDTKKDVWELYDMAHDFNEIVNLADQYPEKVKELKALFDREAKKYNVYPLHDSWFPANHYLQISDSRANEAKE